MRSRILPFEDVRDERIRPREKDPQKKFDNRRKNA